MNDKTKALLLQYKSRDTSFKAKDRTKISQLFRVIEKNLGIRNTD
jgi:hypothetical protein